MTAMEIADQVLARIFEQQGISQDSVDYYYTTTN